MIVAFICLVALAPVLMSIVVAVDGRPGIEIGANRIVLTAIAATLIRTSLLLAIFFTSFRFLRTSFDRDLAKTSLIFSLGGFLFLISTYALSEGLAWRAFEMFISFSVFQVVLALQSKIRLDVLTLVAIYLIFGLVMLNRGPLMVEYIINLGL